MAEKTIYSQLAKVREELSKKEIKKSGFNKYGQYHYHELNDFLPHINELNAKHDVVDQFSVVRREYTVWIGEVIGRQSEMIARLSVFLVDKPEDVIHFEIPYVEAEMLGKNGTKSTTDAIQRMGATLTYNRRYLYLTAYNIAENDMVDAGPKPSDFEGEPDQKPNRQSKPIDEPQIAEIDEKMEEEFKASVLQSITERVSEPKARNRALGKTIAKYGFMKWSEVNFKGINLAEFKKVLEENISTEEQLAKVGI